MHDPERAKYPYASVTEAMTRVINIKQYEKESLLDYSKRFKQANDIFLSHVGNDILDKFTEDLREYKIASDQATKDELNRKSFKKWMAYLIIKNSDQSKYGSLTNNLSSQFSMKINQYPDTVTEAIDILNNHKFDNTKKGGKNGNGYNNKNMTQQEKNEPSDNVSTITKASFQQETMVKENVFAVLRKDITAISVNARTNLRVNGHLQKQHKILQHQMMNNLLIQIILMTGVYHQNGVDYTLV